MPGPAIAVTFLSGHTGEPGCAGRGAKRPPGHGFQSEPAALRFPAPGNAGNGLRRAGLSRGGTAGLRGPDRPQGGPAAVPEAPSRPGRATGSPPARPLASGAAGAGSPQRETRSPAGPGSSFTLSSPARLTDREGEGGPGRAGRVPKMAGRPLGCNRHPLCFSKPPGSECACGSAPQKGKCCTERCCSLLEMVPRAGNALRASREALVTCEEKPQPSGVMGCDCSLLPPLDPRQRP